MRGQWTHTPVLGRGTHGPVPPRKKTAWEGDKLTDTRTLQKTPKKISPNSDHIRGGGQ